MESAPTISTQFKPKKDIPIELCWYPADHANTLVEETDKVHKIIKGEKDSRAIIYKDTTFSKCQSGAPILHWNKHEELEIVGLQIGELVNNGN